MFTRELKKLRQELELTQDEMARRLNMSLSAYHRLEHNDHPSADYVTRICKTFHVDAWAWLKEEEATANATQGPRVIHLSDRSSAPRDEQTDGSSFFTFLFDLFKEWRNRSRGG